MKGFGRSFESRLFPYEEGLENVEALEYMILRCNTNIIC